MIDLFIEPTINSPLIQLESDQGKITIKGRSTPESSVDVYFPVIHKIKHLFAKKKQIEVTIALQYFNTSSSKCLFDLFKELKKFELAGADLRINWCYEEDDIDMLETGEDYADILGLPFFFQPLVEESFLGTQVAC